MVLDYQPVILDARHLFSDFGQNLLDESLISNPPVIHEVLEKDSRNFDYFLERLVTFLRHFGRFDVE